MKKLLHAVLELLEVGDVRSAELLVLDAIDSIDNVSAEPLRCNTCGRTFEWPGLLEAHQYRCVQGWAA